MLYPAQLYKEEVKHKVTSCWYNPKYSHYFSGEYNEIKIGDNAHWRQEFVHLNTDREVDGYFTYAYNDTDKSMNSFGLISFTNYPNYGFIKDCIGRINHMFDMGAQRLEFWAFTDNPACKLYDKFIANHGGRKVCELHRTCYYDGKYHNSCCYEILKEEYKK